jgi:hypothetical protein
MNSNVFQFPGRKRESKDSGAPDTGAQKETGESAKVFDLRVPVKEGGPPAVPNNSPEADLSKLEKEGLSKGLGNLLESLLSPEGSLSAFAKYYESVVNKNSLAEQHAVVRGYSDEEILGFFKNTTEGDWKKKPAFYIALYHEKVSRGI